MLRIPAPVVLAALAALPLAGACSSGGSGGAPPSTVGQDLLVNPFLGAKRALFVPVAFLDVPSTFASTPEGEAELRSLAEGMQTAFARDSYDRVQLTVEYVWPPVSIQRNSTDYPPESALVDSRRDALEAARAAGHEAADFDREVLFLPVAFGGRAANGWVRTVWMSHKLRWVVFHELGHTLGRPHANFWTGDPLGPGPGVEYGDIFDPMGTGRTWDRFHHSGAWFKHISGWLSDEEVLEVTAPGTYTLSPLEEPDPFVGPTALRIRRDADHDYWIFHRATEPLVANGPVIVRTGTDPFQSPQLLDMNPSQGAPEVEDSALAPGQVFDDLAAAGISVRNVTLEGQPVTLEIVVDETRQASLQHPPILDVLTPSFESLVDGVVDFHVVAYDPDEGLFDGAGIERVHLEIQVPIRDPFPVVASIDLLERPYRWTVDTSLLDNAFHYLVITAESADGTSTTAFFRFVVDNGPPPVR